MRGWVLLAAGTIALTSAATAQRALILGPGNASCGRWVASTRDQSDRNFLGSWLGGFISGANALGTRSGLAGEQNDFRDLQLWMDNYCRTHPLEKISEAATALVSSLETQRKR